MSLPTLPNTTLAIIINWVQRMGQIPRHSEKILQIVLGGGEQAQLGNGQKKMPGALILPPSVLARSKSFDGIFWKCYGSTSFAHAFRISECDTVSPMCPLKSVKSQPR